MTETTVRTCIIHLEDALHEWVLGETGNAAEVGAGHLCSSTAKLL